jgi:hypothetical protein
MRDHKTTPTMLVTEAAPVFSLQDLKAEILQLEKDLRKANESLHRIQEIIGLDEGSTTAGPATEASSNRRRHRIPDIIGRDVIGGLTTGGPLPEATSNHQNYVRTYNEEGFCPGDRVRINWDRSFIFGRSTKLKTKTEGKMATVTKVTAQYVWAVVDGETKRIQKRSHNVSLQTPAMGAETVSIQAIGQPERQVQRRTN